MEMFILWLVFLYRNTNEGLITSNIRHQTYLKFDMCVCVLPSL